MTLKNTFLLSSGFSMSFKHFHFLLYCHLLHPRPNLIPHYLKIAPEKQYPQGYLMEVGLVHQSALMEMRVKVNSDVQKCNFDDQTHN